MALRHWTARGTTLIAGLAFCSSVWGQTVTLQKNSRGIERGPSHDDRELDLDEINYADCSADETITFNIGLSDSPDSEYSLEVWRGTNCNDRDTRFSDASGCVKLASLEAPGITTQIPVRVRDIVSGSPTANGGSGGSGGTSGSGGSGGTSGSGGTFGSSGSGGTFGSSGSGGTFGSSGSGGTFGSSGANSFAQAAGFGPIAGSDAGGNGGTAGDAVTAGSSGDGGLGGNAGGGGTTTGDSGAGGSAGVSSGTSGAGGTGGTTVEGIEACESEYSTPQKASLHFFLANASGSSPSGSMPVDWTVTYDLVGPAPPTGVKAGIGENTLVLSWTLPDDTTEIEGYDAYCDPPPGDGAIGAAGAAGAEAEPDPPSGDGDCESSSIVRDELPPSAFLCGSTRGATSSMETRRLENGVNYTVALAARDNFNNRGKLSDTTCNTPQLVTDFFESYRNAGGKGGGGFCSIHAGPSGTLAGALAVAALALVARRRSRRGTVSKDPS